MRGGPDGSGGPHVFVRDLERPELDDDDRHHLERVLRLRRGDALTVSDGSGGWRPVVFGPGDLEPTGEIVRVDAPPTQLTVGFALTKSGKPELVIQKLTELGMDRIAPFRAERSVVRWDDDRAAKNLERLRRVAHEAAMQCRRVRLPTVDPVVDFATIAVGSARMADRGGEAIDRSVTTVLVGPEGGWSDREAGALPVVDLGPHVLRAETAAIAAAVRLSIAHAR